MKFIQKWAIENLHTYLLFFLESYKLSFMIKPFCKRLTGNPMDSCVL